MSKFLVHHFSHPCTLDDDKESTPLNTPVNIPVLDNDIDPDGDDLTTVDSILIQPTNGAVSKIPNGTVTYTPNPGFSGDDSFTYRVCDSDNQCDEAVVTVTVGPEAPDNESPIASEFVLADEQSSIICTCSMSSQVICHSSIFMILVQLLYVSIK